MLDIKIGDVTAVSGWQGKSAVGAWKQSFVDRRTNSAAEGFRLEGFDNPPPTLRSLEQLLVSESFLGVAGLSEKKLTRMGLQCMTAPEFLNLFLDVHDASGSSYALTGAAGVPNQLPGKARTAVHLRTCLLYTSPSPRD